MTETYETEAFERLARIEEESFWFRSRNEMIFWLLDKWCPRARSFLEVGCGTGHVLATIEGRYPGWELAGVEPYAEGITIARKRIPEIPIHAIEAEAMDFESSFDVVGSFDVLEHIPDDAAAIKSIRRALKPGGILLVAVPQHPWLWSAADDFARHQRRYRRDELKARVKANGFEIVDSGSFMSLTLPLMVASRVAYRVRPSRREDPLKDLDLPRLVNRGLEMVLGGERGLIKRGVRFPAGGSLFVVARRI